MLECTPLLGALVEAAHAIKERHERRDAIGLSDETLVGAIDGKVVEAGRGLLLSHLRALAKQCDERRDATRLDDGIQSLLTPPSCELRQTARSVALCVRVAQPD